VEAYALARQRNNIPHKLVLAGAKGWLYESIFARVRELGLEYEILLPSYVPYLELPLWYNCADIFLYPSLYEGFGLPPLEAMACGTAVITLLGFIPCPRWRVRRLDRGSPGCPGPCWRNSRGRGQRRPQGETGGGGPAQAARFSWKDMAQTTLQLYRDLLKWN